MSFLEKVAEKYGDTRPARPFTATPNATGGAQDTGYGLAALAAEAENMRATPEGQRDDTLNNACMKLGGLIRTGQLRRDTVEAVLRPAALATGLPAHQIDEKLDRVLTQGYERTSRTPPPPLDDPDAFPAFLPPPAGTTGQQRERTSWWPRDLDAVLAGHEPDPPPELLRRTDGVALLYRGKVNGLLGESESGKSWIAQHTVVETIHAGQPVVYLDFEDTATGVTARLRALGADDTQLAGLLRYVSPDEALHTLAADDLRELLEHHQPALVVVDGVNAAMTLLGLKLTDNTDATRFAQVLLVPLARTGAAVLYVDHVPKDREQRGKGGIGAQAKRAMTTGCALTVEVVREFGRGMTGRLKLTVDKDRAGHVRGAAGGARNAGTAVLVSHDDDTVTVTIEPPETRAEGAPFRPTRLMEKVSQFLQFAPEGASGYAIEKEVTGKREAIREAIARLVEDGYVTCAPGPRNSMLYRHERLYTELGEASDLALDPTSPPPRPHLTPGEVGPPLSVTSPPPPLPYGGGEVAQVVKGGLLVDPNTGEIGGEVNP